jgi:hypothetical protein
MIPVFARKLPVLPQFAVDGAALAGSRLDPARSAGHGEGRAELPDQQISPAKMQPRS